MNTALQRFIAWMLLASLPLVVAACNGGGGGGGSGNVPMITLSVATKGMIQGASVAIYQLLPDGRTGELLGSGTEGAAGVYSVSIPASKAGGPLLVSVTGKPGATRSVSGSPPVAFTAAESYHAIINDVSPGQSITVSPLTEAAYNKLQQILTVNPALATTVRIGGAVNAANNRIATLFGVSNILGDPASDTAYQAALLIIDQMIIDLGPAANSVTVMNLINSALSNVASPAYQSYLQAVATAANRAALANPSLANAIQKIVTLATSPPAEPDWTDITPPTAPSILSAATDSLTATTSSVTLSWAPATDAKGVTGYSVYRDGVKIATVTTTAYTDQPLANNATYIYYVSAFDGAGNSSVASIPVAVPVGVPTADTTPPTSPGNLSASTFALSPTTSSVVLMWSRATDNKAVTGYEIYRDNSLIATVATPGYTDPLVLIATTYSYYIVALDAAGNRSAPTSPLSVTPNQPSLNVTVNGQLSPGIIGLPGGDIVPPTAPSALSAATFAQTATTSSIVLSWNPSTDNTAVTGYEIYRNGVRIATVTTPGYTDPAVASGSTYNYFIMAFDAAGNRSIASNQLSVTPNVPSLGVTVNGQLSPDIIGLPSMDIFAPSPPANLTAATAALTATTSSVTLSWSPSTDNTAVTGYEIYRGGVRIATVATPGYTDPSVASTLQHTYYIIAFDAAGNRSIAGNQLLVTPNQASLGVTVTGQLSPDIIGLPGQDITAPTAPTNLTAATAALTATTSSVTLSWNLSTDNTAVSGYEIYRGGVKITTVAAPGYTDPSVASASTYNYFVMAIDAAGNRSAASSPLAVTPTTASLGVTFNGQLSSSILGL